MGEIRNWHILVEEDTPFRKYLTIRGDFNGIHCVHNTNMEYSTSGEVLTTHIINKDGNFIETEVNIYLLIGECENLDTLKEDTLNHWNKLCQNS